jgi:hypothetical protein
MGDNRVGVLHGLISGATLFLAFWVAHLSIWQIKNLPGKGVLLIMGLALFTLLLGTLASLFSIIPVPKTALPVMLTFFLLLVTLYLHLYVGILKSVSIRILEQLHYSKGYTLTLDSLEEDYSYREMIGDRLRLLEKMNWVCSNANQYSCLPMGRCLAAFALLAKRLYGLKQTG